MSPIAAWAGRFAGKRVVMILALGLAALAGGWLAGEMKGREIAVLETRIARLQAAHAQALRLAAEDAAARLREAQARGDALTDQLAAASRQAEVLQGELDAQIDLVTHGRACLDAAALRVLDRAPGIAPARAREPTPAGRAAAAGGADAAADPADRAGAGG